MLIKIPKLLVAASVVAIIGGNAFVLSTLASKRASVQQISRSEAILAKLNTIEIQMLDAETGQRGFLLTGKSSYLDPFNRANERVLPSIKDLEALLKQDQRSPPQTAELTIHAAAKLKELRDTVRVYQFGDAVEATTIVDSDHGEQEMDRFRNILASLREEENAELLTKERRWSTLLEWLYLAVFGFSILALLTTAALMRAIERRSSLAARVELTNDLAHELNNPLQITTNLVSLMNGTDPEPQKMREYAQELQRHHNRLIEVSRAILTKTSLWLPGKRK